MGTKFYLGIAGVAAASIAAAILFFALFSWVWAATGLIGAFIVFGGIALGLSWMKDRRDARERDFAA